MRLFDEMEKCFPEMEKHFTQEFYAQDRLSYWGQQQVRDAFWRWTQQHFLSEENELVRLFRHSGVHRSEAMTSELINWFLYDLCAKDDAIRADIAPVQEIRYRSSRRVL